MRVLSRAGICSRKEAERFVAEGRVSVNGRPARDPAVRIDEARDEVALDGQPVARAESIVLALNKPMDCLTSADDERGRRTVYDLLADLVAWVVPVGRLDRNTTGLLLLTNDTLLADRITDPASHLPKVYRALARGLLDEAALERLRRGVELDDGPTRPAQVTALRRGRAGTLLEIVISEGRNRQVRRMVQAVGSRVRFLRRVAVGPVRLTGLAQGAWRFLEPDEVARLRSAAGGEQCKPPRNRGRGSR